MKFHVAMVVKLSLERSVEVTLGKSGPGRGNSLLGGCGHLGGVGHV